MGIFSSILRFHEAGEEANVNNVERFGEPHHSLYTTTKIFTIRHHIDVTDDAEQVVYQADTKVMSLHDRTTVSDAAGNPVAEIERTLISMHERHLVTMSDGLQFQLSNELLHIIRDITNIEGLGWQLQGNILELNFELYDREGNIIAVIAQKMISMHDKYCIDIYQPEHEKIVVTILIALQHMIRDRENAEAAAYSD